MCGHDKSYHISVLFGYEYCKVCYMNDTEFSHRYVPDNLSYIEELAKQKGLV
jgi:isocitrate dehydrogenase kinase/phosphatase